MQIRATPSARASATRRAPRLLAALGALIIASSARAQPVQSGNIFGTVLDAEGRPLAAVSVSIAGPGAPSRSSTDAGGAYRFLNLAPGRYAVTHLLDGFAPVDRKDVVVGVGKSTALTVEMRLRSVETTVEVAGDSPLLDARKLATGAAITRKELVNVPTARDPWVLLRTVPGVLLDREDVGGSESGLQSLVASKGATFLQSTYVVDGVNVTDMSGGTSLDYYDVDALEEVQIQTGGSDPAVQTAGAQFNVVTRRGTNTPRGGARFLATEAGWQSSGVSPELESQLRTQGLERASNRVLAVRDAGADLGGPLLADRVFLWAALGRKRLDVETVGGGTDETTNLHFYGKLNAQLSAKNAAVFSSAVQDYEKRGRDSGPSRPPETTWTEDWITRVFRLEDSHVFGADLFATVQGSVITADNARSSPGRGQAYLDAEGVWHNSYFDSEETQPQAQAGATLFAFRRTGAIGHELRLGVDGRHLPYSEEGEWVGDVYGDAGTYGTPVAWVTRRSVQHVRMTILSGYVSDTLTLRDLTVNVGLRYDHQTGVNRAIHVPGSSASAVAPDIVDRYLRPFDLPENDPGFTWSDWQPRLGVAYAFGKEKKTLARAGFSRFAAPLVTGFVGFTGGTLPVSFGVFPGALLLWSDANGNKRVDPGELVTSRPLATFGFYPSDPTSPFNPNTADPSLGTVKTDELLFGLEREVLPAFSVAGTFTHRRLHDFARLRGIGLSRADYSVKGTVAGTLPDGAAYETPYYGIDASAPHGGRIVENRPDYSQTYTSLELALQKRYTHGWMLRANVIVSSWKQQSGPGAAADPTCRVPGDEATLYFGCEDGGLATQAAGNVEGYKGEVFINARYQGSVTGLYSLPFGLDAAASFSFREGYPIPYHRLVSVPGQIFGEGSKRVSVTRIGDYRYPAVSSLDLRLQKSISALGAELTLSLDCFNALNRTVPLQRNSRLDAETTNFIRETESPRVFRAGARVSF